MTTIGEAISRIRNALKAARDRDWETLLFDMSV